jgi:hypothetical protein
LIVPKRAVNPVRIVAVRSTWFLVIAACSSSEAPIDAAGVDGEVTLDATF